jgi:hypothetical protein
MTTEKTLEYYQEQTQRPGKFQGEDPLTVFIWEESLNGCLDTLSDEEDGGIWAQSIRLTGSEMEMFGTDVPEWAIVQDSQGFVFSMPLDRFATWKG